MERECLRKLRLLLEMNVLTPQDCRGSQTRRDTVKLNNASVLRVLNFFWLGRNGKAFFLLQPWWKFFSRKLFYWEFSSFECSPTLEFDNKMFELNRFQVVWGKFCVEKSFSPLKFKLRHFKRSSSYLLLVLNSFQAPAASNLISL